MPSLDRSSSQYQDYCRQHDSTAFKFIIEAGDVFTSQVLPHIKEEVEAIELTGKSENKKMFFESDITIKYKSRKELDLISLKLIKKGAFINTKSAGVKSFFEKYFSRQDLQQSFNTKNQLAFNNAVFRFYEMIGEEPSQEETFSAFLQRHRISDRPGNLPSELKEIIFDFYSEVINEMHDLFLILSNDLKVSFKPSFSSVRLRQE